jgi:hypothetical protein
MDLTNAKGYTGQDKTYFEANIILYSKTEPTYAQHYYLLI